jgi:hypothetical protein
LSGFATGNLPTVPDQEYGWIDAATPPAALDYPGTPAPSSGVLDGDRFWPGRDPGRLDGRRVVLAVGSNAAPAVLAGKLRRAGAAGPVPMLRAEVAGLGVGHSAHVSTGGYVPAAPFVAPGAIATWALWLTDPQRAAVDATEPNYVRVPLRVADHPLRFEDGRPVEAFDVYASRWGVLGADGVPLRLGTQAELYARLADVDELAGLAPWSDAPAALLALANPTVGTRVREAFVTAGWVVDAGL